MDQINFLVSTTCCVFCSTDGHKYDPRAEKYETDEQQNNCHITVPLSVSIHEISLEIKVVLECVTGKSINNDVC